MAAHIDFHSIYTGCGVKSFNGASYHHPETIIKAFIRSQMGNSKQWDVAQKKYVPKNDINFSDCFLLWSDFDRTTCESQCAGKPPEKGKEAKLSGHKFAAYITKHKLGEVTISPGRHNPLHPERLQKNEKGEVTHAIGLLHIFCWAIDPIALTAWWKENATKAEKKSQPEGDDDYEGD